MNLCFASTMGMPGLDFDTSARELIKYLEDGGIVLHSDDMVTHTATDADGAIWIILVVRYLAPVAVAGQGG